MRRNFLRNIAISLAGILGAGTAAMPIAQSNTVEVVKTQRDFKSNNARVNTKHRVVKEVGGLDLMGSRGAFGMTPKEYGQIYGNGGSKKSNRLRYSHNAKLKRRANA